MRPPEGAGPAAGPEQSMAKNHFARPGEIPKEILPADCSAVALLLLRGLLGDLRLLLLRH